MDSGFQINMMLPEINDETVDWAVHIMYQQAKYGIGYTPKKKGFGLITSAEDIQRAKTILLLAIDMGYTLRRKDSD